MQANTWYVAHHLLKGFLGSPLPVMRRAGRAALAENSVWVRNKHDADHFLDLGWANDFGQATMGSKICQWGQSRSRWMECLINILGYIENML